MGFYILYKELNSKLSLVLPTAESVRVDCGCAFEKDKTKERTGEETRSSEARSLARAAATVSVH